MKTLGALSILEVGKIFNSRYRYRLPPHTAVKYDTGAMYIFEMGEKRVAKQLPKPHNVTVSDTSIT